MQRSKLAVLLLYLVSSRLVPCWAILWTAAVQTDKSYCADYQVDLLISGGGLAIELGAAGTGDPGLGTHKCCV